jgi:hypothetical protein
VNLSRAVAADAGSHRYKQQAHDDRRQHQDLQRGLPVEKPEQEAGRQRRQHVGADTAANGVYTERLRPSTRHFLDQHPGRHRMPGGVAHDGNGEQQGNAPEAGRQGGGEIADRDPPESQQHQ